MNPPVEGAIDFEADPRGYGEARRPRSVKEQVAPGVFYNEAVLFPLWRIPDEQFRVGVLS